MIESGLGRDVFDYVRDNDVKALMSLCEHFADRKDSFVNWRNNDFGHFGETPLIAAVKRGNVEMISLLVAAGANLHLTDWKNRSALSYAKTKGLVQIVELLVQAGAVDYEAKLESPLVGDSSKPVNADMVFNDKPASPVKENLDQVLQIGKRRTTKKGPKPTRASLIRAGLHILPTATSTPQYNPDSPIMPDTSGLTNLSLQPTFENNVDDSIRPEDTSDTPQYVYNYENEDASYLNPSQPASPSESNQHKPIGQGSIPPGRLAHIPSGVYFDPRFLLSARDLREQQLIQHSPSLLSYYLCIQCGLHEALITCAALSTDVFNTKTTLPVEIIDFLGSLVPVPLASIAFTVASKAVDYVTTQHLEKCYANLRGLNPAADPVHSSRLVEGLARRLTINAQDSLLSLEGVAEDVSEDDERIAMDKDSSKKTARSLFGRLGISFLSKIQSLLGLGRESLTPERLAAIHLKELLNYLFLGNLQADPMQITLVIDELTTVIMKLPVEQYDEPKKYDEAFVAIETSIKVERKPPKPPKPSSKKQDSKLLVANTDIVVQTTDLPSVDLDHMSSSMIEVGADTEVISKRRIAEVGESKACCVIA